MLAPWKENCEKPRQYIGLQGDQIINPKGNQPRIFIGRIDAEVEALIFWSPNEKSQLIRKDPVGKDWSQKEKGVAEDDD